MSQSDYESRKREFVIYLIYLLRYPNCNEFWGRLWLKSSQAAKISRYSLQNKNFQFCYGLNALYVTTELSKNSRSYKSNEIFKAISRHIGHETQDKKCIEKELLYPNCVLRKSEREKVANSSLYTSFTMKQLHLIFNDIFHI